MSESNDDCSIMMCSIDEPVVQLGENNSLTVSPFKTDADELDIDDDTGTDGDEEKMLSLKDKPKEIDGDVTDLQTLEDTNDSTSLRKELPSGSSNENESIDIETDDKVIHQSENSADSNSSDSTADVKTCTRDKLSEGEDNHEKTSIEECSSEPESRSEEENLSGAENNEIDRSNRPIHLHQIGPNNKIIFNFVDCHKEVFDLPEKTKVKINYKPKKVKGKGNVLMMITIEDNTDAEDAAFTAMHRKSLRSRMDAFFDSLNYAIDLITPGSIILEIKATSKTSLRSLLDSIENGKLNDIIKEILQQESVFKHIRGKEVTVNVELTIPEEQLEEEGIQIEEDTSTSQLDVGSGIAVTFWEKDDDGDCSDSSSVDPPEVICTDSDHSSSVDPLPKEMKKECPLTEILSTQLPLTQLQQTHPVSVSYGEQNPVLSGQSTKPKEKEKKIFKRLTISIIQDMSDMDPAEIVMVFHDKKASLQNILSKGDLRPQTIHTLISLLGKVSHCHSMTQYVNEVMLTIMRSKFLSTTVSEYISDIEESDPRLKEAVLNMLYLLRTILIKMPTDGFKIVQQIAFLLSGKWKSSTVSDTEVSKEVDSLLELLKETRTQTERKKEISEDNDEDIQTPPESFRDLPIIPKQSELDGTDPIFILPNKVGKKFSNLEEYLECQFRLFRADVIFPLRQGIKEFREFGLRPITSYTFYTGVKVLRPVCSENGLAYRLTFDNERFKHVQWKTSQKLNYGSLLCLSSDEFQEHMLFATVDQRESESLGKGRVDVQFLTDVEFAKSSGDTVFVMVESPAYFESYKDVLKGMQCMTESTFPFKEYILECQNIPKEPSYLRKKPDYLFDLRPLVDESVKITDNPDEAAKQFSPQSKVAKRVKIQTGESWPDIEDMDESQLSAVKHALTREFALIQGPPGTGKTYIGIKLLKVLLHNREVWMEDRSILPILVVCYTNHALDQFLEGLMRVFDGQMIRVGGRIKREKLKQYSLKEARLRVKENKAVPQHLHGGRISTTKNLNKLKKDLDKFAKQIEAAEREIVSEGHLREFMTEKHADMFTRPKKLSVIEWLGIDRKLANLERADDAPDETDYFEDSEDNDEDSDEMLMARRSGRQLEEDTFALFSDTEWDDEEDAKDELVAVDVTNLDSYQESRFLRRTQRQASKEQIRRKRKLKSDLLEQITSQDRMTEEDASKFQDIRKLKSNDKWRLYRHWAHKLSLKARSDVEGIEEEYKKQSIKYKEILMQEDKLILANCSIIGMTTTGAARYQKILNEIGPKIILVEEAAEVLEAHIIGSLSKECQHLILIGDHKQLRPNPTVYQLAKKYNLEISLFERMVKSGIKCDMLQWQHRMRPEIADTIRSIYDNLLKDHPVVNSYSNVRGIAKNVYFVDHQNNHSFDQETKSFTNKHEADYLVALCQYLMKQGYESDQITILTFYSAQIHCLKKLMQREDVRGIEVAAVDGYQGEENDIILLSLVRSKTEGSIGFLKEENRICVALSRAKIGMYVIGNVTHITEQSKLLKKICMHAQEQGKIGPALPLCCPRHPDVIQIKAYTADDIYNSPEGGCNRQCDYRLPCGHICTKVCHAGEHTAYLCSEPCKRRCRNGHQSCEKLCNEECSPCDVLIQTTLKQCGHVQDIPCRVDQTHFQCKERCPVILPCGHKCPGLCGAPHPPCTEPTEADLPCGHHVTTTCGQKENSASCNIPCKTVLKCGHLCQGTCGSCHQGRLHKPCTASCKQILICGHKCESTCNNCPPCEKQCENRCSHKRCELKCNERCTACTDPCETKCRHYKCTATCGEICNMKPCKDRCRKKLSCIPKHVCLGYCSEKCPTICATCDPEKFKEIVSFFPGVNVTSKTRLTALEDCGHVFEVTSFDRWMNESQNDGSERIIKLKECPKCRQPIRRSSRYGNSVKQCLNDIEVVKEKLRGRDHAIIELRRLVSDLSRDFKGSYKNLVDQFRQSPEKESEGSLSAQLTQLNFLKRIASLEQSIRSKYSLSEIQGSKWKHLLSDVEIFKNWISVKVLSFSRQQFDDGQREITRLSLFHYCLVTLSESEELSRDENLSERLTTLISRLERPAVMSTPEIDEALALREEITERIPDVGKWVSDEERIVFVDVVGWRRGQWCKCEKGHVYPIEEFDETAPCPDCEGASGWNPQQKTDDRFLATAIDAAEERTSLVLSDYEYALSLDKELNG